MAQDIRWRLRDVLTVLSTPLIYSVLLPMALLDLWVSAYQYLCFPIYGIPTVRRSQYFVIDRYKLSYLTWWERVNCTYCAYGNGVLAYVTAVAAETEQYWCPIKHARKPRAAHARYEQFAAYGDAKAYRRRLGALRAQLTDQARPRGLKPPRRYQPWPSVRRAWR